MGKFDGVLFVTDYDDTFYNSAHTVSPENKAAVRYFMDNGGRFSIATGRAHRTFTPQIAREGLEFNAPTVLSNGAAIYDYQADRYVAQTLLPDDLPQRMLELCRVFPELAFEAYHGEDIYVFNPNAVTQGHLSLMGVSHTECPIEEMPTPWTKVILQQDTPYLQQVEEYLNAHWSGDCEAIFSNRYLLELTCGGSTKGTMVEQIARLLDIRPEHVYCIGDNQNDIPMLAVSSIPFAPANCAQVVKDWGAHLLCHCDEHAVAQAIALLDAIY